MENTVNCPQCGAELNVEAVLGHSIEEKYQQEYRTKIAEMETGIKKRETALAQKEKTVKEQQTAIDEQVAEQTRAAVAKIEKEIAKETEAKIKSEYEVQVKSLSEAAAETTKQLQVLKSAQIENEKLKRQIKSQEQDLELRYEQQYSQKWKEEEEAIRKKEAERYELRILETQKTASDQAKLIEELKRKNEQGSQQLQGEVQELAIEEFLKDAFRDDVISEVPKGKRGADAVHRVRTRAGTDAGVILYESKRTKAFSNDWVGKLKEDAGRVNADMMIIVTETMPAGMDKLGNLDGVWICSFSEFKVIVPLLRDSLLRISEAYSSQTNKGEKMQLLYDYVTGAGFRRQLEEVIGCHTELKKGYDKERQAMERIWKEREKQLERVLLLTNGFIGSIQGIAGSSVNLLETAEEKLPALGLETEA
ncbi:MAG: DUF2130 domain-containing protein [Planctomycetaceae bacterium]|jgi:hypothetical protein|nr:DUF2130 domain-containing protein [Planctomycetaceae bacterium]